MRTKKREKLHAVTCSWCGAKIREHREVDRSGVCLQCFYKMLSNHLSSQKKTPYGNFVSDR